MLNHIDLCMSTCVVVLKIYQDVQLFGKNMSEVIKYLKIITYLT